ncbi:MAG TPA: RCC1 domain-containing protein, partial [Polyangiales bacterium]
ERDPASALNVHAFAAEGASASSQTLLATSPTHSCALRAGQLYCWGQNFSGQLGTGDLTDSETAVAATMAGQDVVQLVLSTGRTCVRRGSGMVACLGANDAGQRGDGTRAEHASATAVVGVADAVDLAIDEQTSCAVHGTERSVSCWGGATTTKADDPALLPTRIADASGVVELRAGVDGEYCGRLQDDSVRCWSLMEDGWTAAKKVPALSGARSVAMAALGEVCALIGGGPILCHNLENGKTVRLGDSTGNERIIGAGSLAICAVNAAGDWHFWNVLPPLVEILGSPRIAVSVGKPVLDLAFHGFRVCALFAENEVACGEVFDAQLPTLVRVEGLPD